MEELDTVDREFVGQTSENHEIYYASVEAKARKYYMDSLKSRADAIDELRQIAEER